MSFIYQDEKQNLYFHKMYNNKNCYSVTPSLIQYVVNHDLQYLMYSYNELYTLFLRMTFQQYKCNLLDYNLFTKDWKLLTISENATYTNVMKMLAVMRL